MLKPIPLGAFDLQIPLSQGGMAEVWRGVHREQRIPVAIKIMRGTPAKKSALVDALKNEIRAIAALDHPNIVLLLDYGEVPQDASDLSKGQLITGNPYFVMELASGGTLLNHCHNFRWSHLKQTLLHILDALAHAHARGVLHLDMKPANVLVAESYDSRPGIKLSDFGIAYIKQEPETNRAPSNLDTNSSTEGSDNPTFGTPTYMAPEQFSMEFRDYGPWTDLYSFGCLVYRLVCGHPPFDEQEVHQLMWAHISDEPPPLLPLYPVPQGFESWLRLLLAKQPEKRIQRAADAAYLLLEIDDSYEQRLEYNSNPQSFVAFSNDTSLNVLTSSHKRIYTFTTNITKFSEDLAHTAIDKTSREFSSNNRNFSGLVIDELSTSDAKLATTLSAHTFSTIQSKTSSETKTSAETIRTETFSGGELDCYHNGKSNILYPIPPISEHWHREEGFIRTMSLVGASLNLYGVRTIPMAGRVEERNTLWQTLKDVHEHKSARVSIIRGASGTGKSRLVEWICERAHEVGAATILKALHSPIPTDTSGLAPMIARYIHCVAISRQKALSVIKKHLRKQGTFDEYELLGLLELCMPSVTPPSLYSDAKSNNLEENDDDDDVATSTLKRLHLSYSAEHRFAIIERYIRRLSQERPIILFLEDVHWGEESLLFVQYLLKLQSVHPSSVCVFMTVQEEMLADHKNEKYNIEAIEKNDFVKKLYLQPLSESDQRLLIQQLLCLEPELSEQVLNRTQGHPLFAVQLLRDWVHRNFLEPSIDGLKLKEGVQLYIPDSLHQVWLQRLLRLFENYDEDYWLALEVAAALGRYIDNEEWKRICMVANIRDLDGLFKILLENHLIKISTRDSNYNTYSGNLHWEFIHNLLKECIERNSKENKRWKDINCLCAQTLQGLAQDFSLYERVGKYYFIAEMYPEAINNFRDAVINKKHQVGYSQLQQVLDFWEDSLAKSHVDESDIRFGEVALLRVSAYRQQGDLYKAQPILDNLIQKSTNYNWNELHYNAKLASGWVEIDRGYLYNAEAIAKSVILYFKKNSNYYKYCEALRMLGQCYIYMGLHDKAYKVLLVAVKESSKRGYIYEQAHCHRIIGDLCTRFDFLNEAKRNLFTALQYFEQIGDARSLSTTYILIARIAGLLENNVEEAVVQYQFAINILEQIGAINPLAWALSEWAELERLNGSLNLSEKRYWESVVRYDMIGSSMGFLHRMNIAMIHLERKEFSLAKRSFESLLEEFKKRGMHQASWLSRAGLLVCFAYEKNWEEWDHYMLQIESNKEDRGLIMAQDLRPLIQSISLTVAGNNKRRAEQIIMWITEQMEKLKDNYSYSKIKELFDIEMQSINIV